MEETLLLPVLDSIQRASFPFQGNLFRVDMVSRWHRDDVCSSPPPSMCRWGVQQDGIAVMDVERWQRLGGAGGLASTLRGNGAYPTDTMHPGTNS